MLYDLVIVGGGPAGLSAALALGRARKRVLLTDNGPRRNAAAEHIHNFVTRDGTPPDEFRRIAREQLAPYTSIEARDERVESITGARGAFRVQLQSGVVDARRVLLATGMVDDMLPIDGYRELWGKAIFQCPYCHGWEVKDRRWGLLVRQPEWGHLLPFSLMLRGWTQQLTLFMTETFDLPGEVRAQLEAAGIQLETSPVKRLDARNSALEAVELTNGKRIATEVLFAHPPQQQIALVKALGVTLDADGFVQIDPMRRETSVPGIYAAGDLTTRMQGAVFAAAAGMHAAAMINFDLSMDLTG
jgi:thioredoxin reductase